MTTPLAGFHYPPSHPRLVPRRAGPPSHPGLVLRRASQESAREYIREGPRPDWRKFRTGADSRSEPGSPVLGRHMKLALTILGAAGLFFGGVALGLSHRDPLPPKSETVPLSDVIAPAPSP